MRGACALQGVRVIGAHVYCQVLEMDCQERYSISRRLAVWQRQSVYFGVEELGGAYMGEGRVYT